MSERTNRDLGYERQGQVASLVVGAGKQVERRFWANSSIKETSYRAVKEPSPGIVITSWFGVEKVPGMPADPVAALYRVAQTTQRPLYPLRHSSPSDADRLAHIIAPHVTNTVEDTRLAIDTSFQDGGVRVARTIRYGINVKGCHVSDELSLAVGRNVVSLCHVAHRMLERFDSSPLASLPRSLDDETVDAMETNFYSGAFPQETQLDWLEHVSGRQWDNLHTPVLSSDVDRLREILSGPLGLLDR